jgi:hypothetical protein
MRIAGLVAAAAALFVLTAEPAFAQRARTLTRGEARMRAQDVADAAGTPCDVATAVVLGVDDDGRWLYEATCAGGGGFLLHDARLGPLAIDCLAIAGLAEDDPTIRTCRMGGNGDGLGQIRRMARDAGLACAVDEGRMIGLSPFGRRVIEVGCPGLDGYRIEHVGGRTWKAVPCLILADQGVACRYTTAPEQTETARRWLAQGPGESCEVSGVRYMGYSDRGTVFGVACGASPGYVVRLDRSDRPSETLTCADAVHISDGCILSPASVESGAGSRN